MRKRQFWMVSWVSDAHPEEQQETYFDSWGAAMQYYRELIDCPLFSCVLLTTEEGVVSCYYVYREERRADHEEETILDGFLGE